MATDPRSSLWQQYFQNAIAPNTGNVYANYNPNTSFSPTANFQGGTQSSPNSGGIGDSLASFGKMIGNGFLDDLNYLGKGVDSGLSYVSKLGQDLMNSVPVMYNDAFTKNPALDAVKAGHMPSLDDILSGIKGGVSDVNAQFNGANSPYAAAASVWTDPNGVNNFSQNINDITGYSNLMNHLGVPVTPPDMAKGTAGSLAYTLSPGQMVDDIGQLAGGEGIGNLTSMGIQALGKLGNSGSIYRQAAEASKAVPSDTALNDQPRQPWNQTIPQDAAMSADIGTNPFWESKVTPQEGQTNFDNPILSKSLESWAKYGDSKEYNNALKQVMSPTVREMTPTNIKFPQITPQPLMTPTMKNATQQLDELFGTAQQNGLPAGREYEYLQGLHPTLQGAEGTSFDDLLNQLNPPDLEGAPRVNAAGVTSKDMIGNLLNMGQKPLDEIEAALGAKIGKTPAALKPSEVPNMSDLGSMLDSLNGDISSADKANLMDTLGKGTGLRPEDLQNIADLNELNPTKGAFDIPDFLNDPAATESTAHPNPTSELPNEMPSAEEVYQGLGDKFKSTLQANPALLDAQKPQWLQRIQDAMARWGIMGSGLENSTLKNNGASDIIKNGVAGGNNDAETVAKWAEDLAKGLTPSDIQDLKDARTAYENGNYTKGDNPIFDKLIDALHYGVPGTKSGLLAEQGSGVAAKDLRENYFPLMMDMKNTPEDLRNALAQEFQDNGMNLNRRVYDRSYTLDRKYPNTYTAEQDGYAVHDPITATALRLQKSAQDVNMANMYKQLEQEGLQKGYVGVKPVANSIKYNSKDGTVNTLNGKFLHKDLAGALTTMFDRTPWSHANIPVISPALQAWDKMTNFYRNATLYTPMVHLHNVFGNALMGAGISPADYLEAEQMLKSAPDSLAVQMAKKTGALGEEFGQDTATRIQKAMGNNPTGWEGLKDKAQSLQNTTLWDREKALRLGVFKKYFESAMGQGMTTADAANVARDATLRHMVDYSSNNLSTFEKEVMSRIDPFYRWHRGNYALQASKLISDPRYIGKVAGVQNMLNNIQQDNTGHDLAHNIGGDRLSLQSPMDNQGNFTSYSPYLPYQETFKLMEQNPANTAFNRLNPFIRESMNQATNNQFYPAQSVTPMGKDYMTGTNYPIANPATSGGQQLWDRAVHGLSHTILPDDQAVPSAVRAAYQGINGAATGKYPEVPAWNQLVADLTGGFLQSTPTSQQKVNAQDKKELKWLQQYKKMAQRGN